MLLLELDKLETKRSLEPNSARNQANKDRRATVEEEIEESTKNAKHQKKEKKKGKGKLVRLLLPELHKKADESVEDTNQGASVNVESTKKTSDNRATKNKSNGLFVDTQKSPEKREAAPTKDGDKEVMRILNTDPRFYFKVLGLNDLNDGPKVPSAYRKLALKVHLDRNKHP